MAEILTDFHFLRPWWFLALIPAIVAAILLFRRQQQSGQWQNIIAPHLLPFLLDGAEATRRKYWALGALLLWVVTIAAIAGPAWQKLPEPVEQKTSALIVIWDQSLSMLAQDIKPSRVNRSRLKIIDLLNNRKEGLTGLVSYSGEAYTVSPVTDDVETITNLLPALNPTIMPSRGSNVEMAFDMASDLLAKAGVNQGDILLVTDDIAADAMDYLREEISLSPHQLTIWGVGTQTGAPIPLPRGGFVKQSGQIFVAKLNEQAIQEFASRSSSYYVPMVQTESDISTIERLVDSIKTNTTQTERVFDQWFEHGQYLCVLLLALTAIGYRKGWLLSMCLIVPLSLFQTEQSMAFEVKDLFLTPDQQAKKLFEQGDIENAAKTFDNDQWKGTAQFQAKQYEQAAQSFAKSADPQGFYNQGTSLTHAGKYDDAIEKFDHALKLNPDLESARKNKAIAEKLKQQQEQQSQDQQSQNQDSQQDNSKQQDPNQQGQQSDSDQQQNGDPQQNNSQQQNQQNAQSPNDNQQDHPQDDPSNNSADQQTDAQEQQAQQQSAEQNQEDAEKQNEQAAQEALAQQQAQKKQQQDSEANSEQTAMAQHDENKPQTEQEQMLENWLRKVPDDPSGLLRNKLAHQYRQRQQEMKTPGNFSSRKNKSQRF